MYVNTGATTGVITSLTNGNLTWLNGWQYIFSITYRTAV
jgi:hypothetical protein